MQSYTNLAFHRNYYSRHLFLLARLISFEVMARVQMGKSRVHPWMSYQFITGLYVSICGFATLLKGTFTVL